MADSRGAGRGGKGRVRPEEDVEGGHASARRAHGRGEEGKGGDPLGAADRNGGGRGGGDPEVWSTWDSSVTSSRGRAEESRRGAGRGGGDEGGGDLEGAQDRNGGGGEGDDEPCCSCSSSGIRLSPFVLLLLFIYANLLNYVDRGLVAGVLPTYCVSCPTITNRTGCEGRRSCEWDFDSTLDNSTCAFNTSVTPQFGIGGSFNISETEQGILAGAFMGGYCLFSPIFAHLSTVYPPFKLMAAGLGAWVLSCIMGATATSYDRLLLARVVSGIGEASFQCLAPPFIDDSAGPTQKGKWLAAFFMATPIGQALGYAFGGAMCSMLDSDRLGFASWRVAFGLEALAMAPVALLCLCLTNKLKGETSEHGAKEGGGGLRQAYLSVKEIVSNAIWMCAVLGYGAFTFSVGAMAVWGPYYVQRTFWAPLDEADIAFGGVAVFTGLFGTAAGGMILDKVSQRMGGDILSSSLLVTVVLTFVAWPFCFLAFNVKSYELFFLFMLLGQFFAFATTSPINGVILWCVRPELRTLSMALAVVGMHLLGDVPSPVVVGAMLESMPDASVTMTIVTVWIGWCIVFWGAAFVLARRRLWKPQDGLQRSLLEEQDPQ